MAYTVCASDEKGYLKNWFLNAVFAAVFAETNTITPVNIGTYDYIMKERYGLTVIRRYTSENLPMRYVEFPSEADATMFLLRWS